MSFIPGVQSGPDGNMDGTAAADKRNLGKLDLVGVYQGPSSFARRPVMVARLRRAMCPEAPVAQAVDQLQISLREIEVSWPDGSGLDHAHAYALVIARLAHGLLNGRRGFIEESGAMTTGRKDALLWVGYHQPEITAKALELATEWVAWAGGRNPPSDVPASVASAKAAQLASATLGLLQTCAKDHPDYIARILMIAARAAGVPVQLGMQPRVWQYGSGSRSSMFVEAFSIRDSFFDVQIARNKFATAKLLRYLGFPNSAPRAAETIAEAAKCLAELGTPVVVKPPDGGKGRGITVGVRTAADLQHAFDLARSNSDGKKVLIERFIEGHDHRLLVVRGKLVAATRREPPSVSGDGQATVRQLVARLNADRRANPVLRRYLKQVTFDEVVTHHIESAGMTPDSVPQAGQEVSLRGNANVSSGGTPYDVLHLVHPEIRIMAETLAANLAVSAVGIDYLTSDVSRAWGDVGGAVIEINTSPGLDLHVAAGMQEAAIGKIILGEGLGPVPTVLVVCSEDRVGFWEQLLESNAARWPANTARLTPVSARLGRLPLLLDGSLFARARQCLANQAVDAFVVVSVLKPVLAGGLPVSFTSLAILDTPFTDERDPERQLIAQHCPTVLDLRREPISPETLVNRIGQALIASDLETPVTNTPSGKIRPAQKYRAGEIELDVLRFHEMRAAPTVFSIVRNSRYLTPHFLNHYRSLGVEQFVFFDDQSNDGTRELLLEQPDAMVLGSSLRFHERLSNGKKLHQNLKNWIPASLGEHRWVITVDADEFLVLPGATPTVPAMIAVLEARGHTTVLASMIDFFPPRLAGRHHDLSISPFVASPFFDQAKGFARDRLGHIQKTPGGIRWRLQEWLKQEEPEIYRRIYEGRGYVRGASWKSPFVKTGTGTWLINSHSTNCPPPDDIELALAHFKFHPGLDLTIAEGLAFNSHYANSIEYHFLKAAVEAFNERDLVGDDTHRYEGRTALEEAGLCWIR